jgi:hypothetical protein
MLYNNSGRGNVAIGEEALRRNEGGNENVAIGDSALWGNETSLRNIAIGPFAMKNALAGNFNIAMGINTLKNNVSGQHNIAIGSSSMNNNQSGAYNIAIGGNALNDNTTGHTNLVMGSNAMTNNTTGYENVALGALTLEFNSNGFQNTAVGFNAGIFNQTGDQNTYIGAHADCSSSGYNKSIAIGYGATIGGSNNCHLGGTGVNQVQVGIGRDFVTADLDIKQDFVSGNGRGIKLEREDNTDDWRMYIGAGSDLGFAFNNTVKGMIDDATGDYVPSSDMRLKRDISPLGNVLDKINQLQPKTYQFIDDISNTKAIGFIAQEVEIVFPEIVREREDGYKGLAYDNFSVIAIQAIKEQQVIISQQQAIINDLLARVSALEND